jgi:aminopeptidase N
VTLQDLWRGLSEASGFDVKNFMDGYTKVTGTVVLLFVFVFFVFA